MAAFGIFESAQWLKPAEVNPLNKDGWLLVWHDEFNGPSIDHKKWNVLNEPSPRNNELQYYAPDDVYIKDGMLRIKSERRDYKGKSYTSGGVTTKNKFHFLFGKVEIRARLPKGQGIWPAYWAPPAGQAPYEIDIMEMLGHEPNKIYMTSHWLGNEHRQHQSTYIGPDFSAGFHTFSIEWEPDRIRWLIDNVERYTLIQDVPNVPSILFLNTAIGGVWPGNPDETTQFPQFNDIDYVRVYTKEP